MKKISKKVREDAALICSILASNDGAWSDDLAEDMEISREAADLVEEAFDYVTRRVEWWTMHSDAEAESLIRTGWSPS